MEKTVVKKHVACIAAAGMLVCLLLAVCSAAGAASNGTCGENLTWVLDDEGVLTISGTGEMCNYDGDSYSFPWYYSRNRIQSIIINESVETISPFAFCECKNLGKVAIANSVISIGYCSFGYCDNLVSITIPNGIEYIEEGSFEECHNLESIDVAPRNSNYSSVNGVVYSKDKKSIILCPAGKKGTYSIPNGTERIDYRAFGNCKKLTNIVIPDSVSIINGYAFDYCTSLTDITLPNSIRRIETGSFRYCKSLTNITLPKELISIGHSAFTDCLSLENISLPSSLKEINYYAFSGCRKLKSITIPQSITSIYNSTFSYCYELTDVVLPYGLNYIGHNAFYDCRSLTNIQIPDTVTGIGQDAFSYCPVVFYADLNSNLAIILSQANYSFRIPGLDYDLRYIINDGVVSGLSLVNVDDDVSVVSVPQDVTAIADYAFYEHPNLTSISIPESVTTIGNYAFYECNSLKSITIPSSVTSIGNYAFRRCYDLGCIHISNKSDISFGTGAFADVRHTVYSFDDGRYYLKNPTVYCYEYSPVEAWAQLNEFNIILLDDHPVEEFLTVSMPDRLTMPVASQTDLVVDVFPNLPTMQKRWASSDTEVATVDQNGRVDALTPGSTDITLDVEGITATCHLTVQRMADYISIHLPETLTIGVGTTAQLPLEIYPAVKGLSVAWSSNRRSVARVSDTGVVSAIKAGKAIITVNVEGVTAACEVTAVNYASDFSVGDVWVVAKTQCPATPSDLAPADAVTDFSWSTGNHLYATVDSNGVVTGRAAGETTLILTDNLSGLMRTATIHSCYPVTSVAFAEATPVLPVGVPSTLAAHVNMRTQHTANHLVAFRSSDESIATVTQDGVVTGLRQGAVTITATSQNGFADACRVTFTGAMAHILTLPQSLTTIESEAFAGLTDVDAIRLHTGIEQIADDAFAGSDIVLLVPAGSPWKQWALDRGIGAVEE